MKSLLLPSLFAITLLIVGLLGLGANIGKVVYAQDPVITSTVVSPVPLSDTSPVPIPPTLLELLTELINEGAGWLTGIVLLGLGIGHTWLVSFVRGLFPNDDKTATKINGGLAELVSGATSITTALIAYGVVWLTGFASSFDMTSLLELAGVTYASGFSVHKLNKLSSIAKALKSK